MGIILARRRWLMNSLPCPWSLFCDVLISSFESLLARSFLFHLTSVQQLTTPFSSLMPTPIQRASSLVSAVNAITNGSSNHSISTTISSSNNNSSNSRAMMYTNNNTMMPSDIASSDAVVGAAPTHHRVYTPFGHGYRPGGSPPHPGHRG